MADRVGYACDRAEASRETFVVRRSTPRSFTPNAEPVDEGPLHRLHSEHHAGGGRAYATYKSCESRANAMAGRVRGLPAPEMCSWCLKE